MRKRITAVFAPRYDSALAITDTNGRKARHLILPSEAEMRQVGVEKDTTYKVTNYDFPGANKLKQRSPSSYSFITYARGKYSIELCGTELKTYFKDVPETIYFKAYKTQKA